MEARPRRAAAIAANFARKAANEEERVATRAPPRPTKKRPAGAGNLNENEQVAGVTGGFTSRAEKGGSKRSKNNNRAGFIPGQNALSQRMQNVVTSFRPAFSMAQLQSWSGSELETRAIETAVRAAANKGMNIEPRKFNRKSNVLGGAAQIFDVKKRTFFFKPRFNLDPIKNDPNPKFTAVMKNVVTKTAGKLGKGSDDIEPDVIEAYPVGSVVNRTIYPYGLIRIYECKIGLGKPEGTAKAGESLQLMKAKRLLEIFWERMTGDINLTAKPANYPVIECYFLAWKFGERGQLITIKNSKINKNDNIDFIHHSIPFPEVSTALNEAGAGRQGTAKWDTVQTIGPEAFATLTGLDSRFVEGYLRAHRTEIYRYFQMLLSTLLKRGVGFGNLNQDLRKALGPGPLISGQGLTLRAPQGPNKQLQMRIEGRLANLMESWSPSMYNYLGNNVKREQVSNNKRYFSNKATRAALRLVQQGLYTFQTAGGNSANNLPAPSASEINRRVNNKGKFINNKNIDEYRRRVEIAIKRSNNIINLSRRAFFKGAKLVPTSGSKSNNENVNSSGLNRNISEQVKRNKELFDRDPVAAISRLVNGHLNNANYLNKARMTVKYIKGPSAVNKFNAVVLRKKLRLVATKE